MRTPILLLLAALALAGCNEIVPPTAATFTGRSGGCGAFHLYRYNPEFTSAVSLNLRDDSLALPNGGSTFTISPDSKVAEVLVQQFSEPAPTYYCDDVAGDPQPVATWRAISGRLAVTVAGKNPSDTTLWQHPYTVSVVMSDVVLENEATKETSQLSEVKIENAVVGWLPG